MNYLERLIKEKCPNGVEYKTLEELGTFYSGLKAKAKSDFGHGNGEFISYMNIFKNPSVKLDELEKIDVKENENQNEVQYGDILFTGSSENIDECAMSSVVVTQPDKKVYMNSFCFGFRLNEPSVFNPHFAKHLFHLKKSKYWKIYLL